MCIPVHDILNCMFLTGEYPDFWKRAQITPIPKVANPKLYKDFRPISLLHHLGKLCEQVIIDKLKHSLEIFIESDQYAYSQTKAPLMLFYSYLMIVLQT